MDYASELIDQMVLHSAIEEKDVDICWMRWNWILLRIMKQYIPQATLPNNINAPWLIKKVCASNQEKNLFLWEGQVKPYQEFFCTL